MSKSLVTEANKVAVNWAKCLSELMETNRADEELSAVKVDELVEFAFQKAKSEILANSQAIADLFNQLHLAQPGAAFSCKIAEFEKSIDSFAILTVMLD